MSYQNESANLYGPIKSGYNKSQSMPEKTFNDAIIFIKKEARMSELLEYEERADILNQIVMMLEKL